MENTIQIDNADRMSFIVFILSGVSFLILCFIPALSIGLGTVIVSLVGIILSVYPFVLKPEEKVRKSPLLYLNLPSMIFWFSLCANAI